MILCITFLRYMYHRITHPWVRALRISAKSTKAGSKPAFVLSGGGQRGSHLLPAPTVALINTNYIAYFRAPFAVLICTPAEAGQIRHGTFSPTRGFEPRAFLQKTQKQAQSLLLCFLAEDMGLEPTGRCRLT